MVKIVDNGQRASIEFRKGRNLAVIYKYMTDKSFVIHYHLDNVSGSRKVTPRSFDRYDDVIGMAECGLSYMFFPLLLDQLIKEFSETANSLNAILNLYDTKGAKAVQEKFGYATYFNTIAQDDKKQSLTRHRRKAEVSYVTQLLEMKAQLAKDSIVTSEQV